MVVHRIQYSAQVIQINSGLQTLAAEGSEDQSSNFSNAIFLGRQGKTEPVLNHLGQGAMGLGRQLLCSLIKRVVYLESSSNA